MKDNDFGDSSINFSFEKARHLILTVDKNSSFPTSIYNIKNLRSLLFQFESGMNSFDGVLLELLGKNTCLRALAMGGTAKFDMMTGWQYGHPIKLERIPKEIRKLTHLSQLEGSLGIKSLGNVTNVSEAHRIQLENKKNILKLELGFGGSDSVNNEAIIEALQPPPNLQRLAISEYAGNAVLPNWITSLTNLRSIWLIEWINCEQLPPLGKVSSLESIVIQRMKRVKRVGIEILGLESDGITLSSSSSSISAFPKLKTLKFVEMEELEEWDFGIEDDNITIMPSLRVLQIEDCPKLKVLPKKILPMAPLEVLSIDRCPILMDRYREGTGENWSDISHIPNIQIDRQYMQRNGR
ncbi:hypothetical protein LWI28_015033 [Acer negundo]|uniref:R13L1/DRL21-like LRR repeat region domain-containing protein n=1 Tax=Acer negundo TaxID=4023 RepID=A0AAD5IE40_ACENE|nr:hypothetical protein LWI28_015033 [Acer negundo]